VHAAMQARYVTVLGKDHVTAFATEVHTSSIRVNALMPRGAVATEEAVARGLHGVPAELVEPVECMAEAALLLATCAVDRTGGVFQSRALLAEAGREIRALDGRRFTEKEGSS